MGELRAAGPDSGRHYVRTYSAKAEVTILSVTVFSRPDVGGGFAALDESPDGRNLRLRFLSGSTPSRAHGLNRQGFIDEEQTTSGAAETVEYFGFISSNRERSLSEARAAVEKTSQSLVPYTAAKGISHGSEMTFRVAKLDLPSSFGWSHPFQLVSTAADDFAAIAANGRTGKETEIQLAAGDAPLTFLRALVRAIQSSDVKNRQQYAYNGNLYELETAKQQDRQTGTELVARNLAQNASDIIRLKGTIVRQGENSTEQFQLWFDRSSSNPLPLRFEYRPRSYLKLLFDAEPPNSAGRTARLIAELPDKALLSPASLR